MHISPRSSMTITPLMGIMALVLSNIPGRADTSCDRLASAMLADTKVPFHSMSITTNLAGGTGAQDTSQTSETISTRGSVYVRFGSGKWKQVDIPLDELTEAVHHNAGSFTGCHHLADENINGKRLAIYTGHSVRPDSVIEMKVWVEPTQDVMLRSETDIVPNPTSASNSHFNKRHVETRYNFTDVSAPTIEK